MTTSEILFSCSCLKISLAAFNLSAFALGLSLENINSFDEKDWQEIYKLSENTFVEETEELKKSAAGAGLTDND